MLELIESVLVLCFLNTCTTYHFFFFFISISSILLWDGWKQIKLNLIALLNTLRKCFLLLLFRTATPTLLKWTKKSISFASFTSRYWNLFLANLWRYAVARIVNLTICKQCKATKWIAYTLDAFNETIAFRLLNISRWLFFRVRGWIYVSHRVYR